MYKPRKHICNNMLCRNRPTCVHDSNNNQCTLENFKGIITFERVIRGH